MKGKLTIILAVAVVALLLLIKNGNIDVKELVDNNTGEAKEELSLLERYNRFSDKMNDFWGGLLKDLGLTDEVAQSYEKDENLADTVSEYVDKVESLTATADAATGESVSISSNNVDLEAAELVGVVDGDTIIVEMNGSEEKVRFIGIDTPESVHEDESKNTVYGTYASDYTKSLLNGVETVYLQYDEQVNDQYGRTLAYVWVTDNVDVDNEIDISAYMLNAILLEEGYAYDKVYMPNDEYNTLFNGYRKAAQEDKVGLWEYPEFALLWE